MRKERKMKSNDFCRKGYNDGIKSVHNKLNNILENFLVKPDAENKATTSKISSATSNTVILTKSKKNKKLEIAAEGSTTSSDIAHRDDAELFFFDIAGNRLSRSQSDQSNVNHKEFKNKKTVVDMVDSDLEITYYDKNESKNDDEKISTGSIEPSHKTSGDTAPNKKKKKNKELFFFSGNKSTQNSDPFNDKVSVVDMVDSDIEITYSNPHKKKIAKDKIQSPNVLKQTLPKKLQNKISKKLTTKLAKKEDIKTKLKKNTLNNVIENIEKDTDKCNNQDQRKIDTSLEESLKSSIPVHDSSFELIDTDFRKNKKSKYKYRDNEKFFVESESLLTYHKKKKKLKNETLDVLSSEIPKLHKVVLETSSSSRCDLENLTEEHPSKKIKLESENFHTEDETQLYLPKKKKKKNRKLKDDFFKDVDYETQIHNSSFEIIDTQEDEKMQEISVSKNFEPKRKKKKADRTYGSTDYSLNDLMDTVLENGKQNKEKTDNVIGEENISIKSVNACIKTGVSQDLFENSYNDEETLENIKSFIETTAKEKRKEQQNSKQPIEENKDSGFEDNDNIPKTAKEVENVVNHKGVKKGKTKQTEKSTTGTNHLDENEELLKESSKNGSTEELSSKRKANNLGHIRDYESQSKGKKKRNNNFDLVLSNFDQYSDQDVISNKKKLTVDDIYSDNENISRKKKTANNEITDEELEFLKNLTIKLPFNEIPPLHQINRSSKPTLVDMQKANELNAKFGPFSKLEDAIIIKNWEHFCMSHKVRVRPQVFFKFQRSRGMQEKIKFLQYISSGLEDRMPFRVHTRFKKIFGSQNLKKGRYTPKEDQQIIEFMTETSSSRPFYDLGILLNRSQESVEKRHAFLASNDNKSPVQWDVKMSERLIKGIMKIVKTDNVKDLEHLILKENQWKELSLIMDNISVKKLQRAWKISVHSRLFMKENKNEIKLDLVKMMVFNRENDFRTISWERYAENFVGITPRKLNDIFRITFKAVPKEFKNNLESSLNYLLNHFKKRNNRNQLRYKFKNGKLICKQIKIE